MIQMRFFKYILVAAMLAIAVNIADAMEKQDTGTLKTSALLNAEASVAGANIFLGDIASISSSSETFAAKLKKINICRAAQPGDSQVVHIGYVKTRVRQQGIAPEVINWEGAEQTLVKTDFQHLLPQNILSYAKNFIQEQVIQKQKAGEVLPNIQIQPVNEIQPIVLPCGNVGIVVNATPSAIRNGVIPLRFIISVDGREIAKRMIFFKATIIKEVVTAARMISRHRIITEDDLCLALQDVSSLLMNTAILSRTEDIIGKRAKKMIKQGVVIAEDIVEEIPIINRGDLVTIVIESPVFRITTQGRARQAGARNQMIKVINTSSMKEITAEVMDAKIVRVIAANHK